MKNLVVKRPAASPRRAAPPPATVAIPSIKKGRVELDRGFAGAKRHRCSYGLSILWRARPRGGALRPRAGVKKPRRLVLGHRGD